MKNELINIAGLNIDPIRFPKLYRIAKNNPEGLKAQLRSLDKALGGESNIISAAIYLENDLQHG